MIFRRLDRGRLLAGAALGTAGVLGTAALGAGGVRPPAVLVPLALGVAAGAALQTLVLLRRPGTPAGAAVRHTLDGALVALCTLYVAWTLGIEPAYHPRLTSTGNLVVAGPALAVLGAGGVLFVVVWRAARPRAALARSAASVVVAGAAGVALLVTLRQGNGAAAVAAAALCALGHLGATRPAGLSAPERAAGVPRDALLTWVPVLAGIAAAALRLAVVAGIDDVSAVIAGLIGVALCARQASALRQTRGYAEQLAREQEALRELAHSDALTGLGNRRRLAEVLAGAAEDARFALLAIDLDGFKNVNDLRGHDVGDAVLVEVADRLRTNLRPGDLPVRLGGDEFAVLMWSGLDEAERVAGRLLGVLSRPYQIDGVSVFLSASVGLAGGAGPGEVAALLRNADMSLRFAKQRGKNRAERFDAAYEQWLRRRNEVEHELRGALERDELALAYQPVLALPGALPVGAEALLRWHHPRLGQVSPAEFIPIAEEAGLVGRLDRWVLHQACHQLSRWLAEGHDVWVSVNVSARELHLPEYVAQVLDVVREHRLPRGRLVLEVAAPSGADEELEALRSAGVRVALDNFGAGYWSVSRLPGDILKIDRSVVQTGTLVDVVVRLGERLGLDVVAEGVAEPAQRAVVEAAGCRLGQGDLFFPPMPAEHVEALLARAQHLGQVDSGHEMRQA